MGTVLNVIVETSTLIPDSIPAPYNTVQPKYRFP